MLKKLNALVVKEVCSGTAGIPNRTTSSLGRPMPWHHIFSREHQAPYEISLLYKLFFSGQTFTSYKTSASANLSPFLTYIPLLKIM